MFNAARRFAFFLNTRPLCFLSVVFGLRDIVVGLGLIFPSDYRSTVLYQNLSELGGAAIFGWLLTISSILLIVSAVMNNMRIAHQVLSLMSWFWLFGALSYFLSGHWVFGLANMFMCSLPAGYIAFYYKWMMIVEGGPKRRRGRNGV